MARTLTDWIECEGPTSFERDELEALKEDLFDQRAALFYTPTSSIPRRYVGAGRLDVRLPIAPPSRLELRELIGHRYPRVWVDLIQRATGMLRWEPPPFARVFVEIHDAREESYYTPVGAKALIDALKAKTTGRPDARLLYYFGAILDDAPKYIEIDVMQHRVESAAEAFTRIVVEPCDDTRRRRSSER